MSNSPFLNFWNHSRQLLSLKAASPHVSTNNQCASAADFFKFESKLVMFAHKIIYYMGKNSLIFQGYVVDRCPSLRQWRFTSVNFIQNSLVALTFVKRRKFICTPDIIFLMQFFRSYQVKFLFYFYLNKIITFKILIFKIRNIKKPHSTEHIFYLRKSFFNFTIIIII